MRLRGCTGLTGLTLGASLKTINAEAFKDCTGLQTVTISRYVATIGEGVFDGCTALTAIEVAEGNLTYKSADGNLYSADGTQLIRYAAGKTAESFAVPEGRHDDLRRRVQGLRGSEERDDFRRRYDG